MGGRVCMRVVHVEIQISVQPHSERTVKAVMWSPTAGLHHCEAAPNTKGGLFAEPLPQEHM